MGRGMLRKIALPQALRDIKFEDSKEAAMLIPGLPGFWSCFRHWCGESTATTWASFEGGQRGATPAPEALIGPQRRI